MSIAPITFPTELDPTFQEVTLQDNPDVEKTTVQETVVQRGNPAVTAVTVQATTEGQPTETTVTTIQDPRNKFRSLRKPRLSSSPWWGKRRSDCQRNRPEHSPSR
jgi:hypothetical protein